MDDFVSLCAKYCRKYSMLPCGGLVIAAVSGGADSVCLLHVLHALSVEFDFRLIAAHYNHRLRGEESDRDESFVKNECEKLGVECFVGSGDVASYAETTHTGTEEAARIMRYAFFEDLMLRTGAGCTATAHNADDNIETVLLNLTRGTSSVNGIPPVREKYIRPLLFAERADITKYLNDNSIPHVEDSTNASDDYSRNRLRHRVVPVLRELNPALAKSILNACELSSDDSEYLSRMADDFISENYVDGRINAEKLASLPNPVSGRVIRKLVPSSSRVHVDAVRALCASDDPSASLDLPGITVRREYKDLVFGSDDAKELAFSVLREGITELPEAGLRLTCRKNVFSGIIHKTFNHLDVNCNIIKGDVIIRPRQPGDRISLSPGITKSLRKLFIEKHIPASRRGIIPVIADDRGVLAVYGIGVDIKARPKRGDTVLNIDFEEII